MSEEITLSKLSNEDLVRIFRDSITRCSLTESSIIKSLIVISCDKKEKELLSRLSRLERGERAIQAYNQIADIVHNYSCHSAEEAYARITRIVMDNERPREDRNDG